jgi:hypothetical protein
MRGTAESYRVFVRNWWRYDVGSFGQRVKVPNPGARKTTLATGCTYDEAYALCQRYAERHKPGPLSRKAEFERE